MKTLTELHEQLHTLYEQRQQATLIEGNLSSDYWTEKIEELRREIEERKSENIMDLFA